MAEHHTPSLVDVNPDTNLNDLLADRVARAGELPLFERPDEHGGWRPVTALAFDAEVLAVARGLIASGVQPGDRVGIMSRTRYEWSLLDFAVWAAGAVSVPLYETSSAEQLAWIIQDAQVKLLIVETSENWETSDVISPRPQTLTETLTINDGAIAELIDRGTTQPEAEVHRRRKIASLSDPATIIYTSGTTGRPKGAVLTHRNFSVLTQQAVAGLNVVVAEPGSRTLLFMPMAHVFARFISVLVITANTAVMGHSPDTRQLLADLASFRPTFLLSVPRVFEKVYNSSEQKAADGGKLKIFRWAAVTAIGYSRALDTPGGPSFFLRLRHKLADRLVFGKLRAALGGQTAWAISGGAPLGERLGHFYRGIGLHVLEGYGLTETTAPATVNLPGKVKIGTVGPPLPGTGVAISDDGEILIQGPHVFTEYHANPEATAAAFQDGWFRTGDIGSLDADGYLRITGRKKEIIITAGGKNVAPAVLEDRLRGHPLVSQCVVVGDQRPYIGALVTLDTEALPGWLRTHDRPGLTLQQALTDPAVIDSIGRGIRRANEPVSRAESIRRFVILPQDFTIENGYLTPSLKVKRNEVIADQQQIIDDLYHGIGHDVPSD